ncbi:MAG: hypothetical protein K0U59_06565 [Gammaproteobacteria bacterium]|nr:hypothetical protein [Gammaproteobacteria bacterium]
MDLKTFIGLLTLMVTIFGGLISHLWSRLNSSSQQIWASVNALSQQQTDDRVRAAEQFITTSEMERRIQQAIAPLERSMERVEKQNDQIFKLLTERYPKEISG